MAHALKMAAAALAFAAGAAVADFGSAGGPQPTNVDEVVSVLRRDPYDLELLISFGTSKGGSAGHLALALRDEVSDDDLVYSANFYADRSPKHAQGYYTADLMIAVPKKEYLFATTSSLGGTASFGLDFGEIYKRSVIGIRVYGVPAAEKEALASFFKRVNDDYRKRAPKTEYHDGEIKYDYLHLNCAKTIGAAFRYGAGYGNLRISGSKLSPRRKVASAVNANIPTEMAMKLLDEWNARGYGLDVVLYRKYGRSNYVDPREDEKVAFRDLPNRFPSVLSRDFRKEQGEYRDFDNLFAMYVLHEMGRYSVRISDATRLLEIERSRSPLAYPEAAERAVANARSDSRRFLGRTPFRPRGTTVEGNADDANRYELAPRSEKGPTRPTPRSDAGASAK